MGILQLGGFGACKSPLSYFATYHSKIRLYETLFLLTTHSNFSVLNFKLGVQTNYPLARMFFFRTLAAAFPTSYRMKTVLVEFENSAIVHATIHYAFHNSVSLTLLQLPVLNSRSLYQAVYRMSNFQIIPIELTSLVKDTFCLQLR